MIDDIFRWLKQLLDVGAQHPGLIALVVGSFVGYVFTVMMELYFLPIVEDMKEKRRQKGLTFVLCWMASGTASSILWTVLDQQYRPALHISVSYVIAILAFAGYPLLAKLATNLFPKIGSAWAKPPA